MLMETRDTTWVVVKRPDLTPDQNARVLAAALKLRERFDSATALGRAIGISQGGISAYLSGKNGASLATATRVAKLAGVSVGELLGEDVTARIVVPLDTRPVLSSLPGWHEALARAKRSAHYLPSRAFEYAAQQNALFMLSVTEADVVRAAKFWRDVAEEHVQDAAAVAQSEESLAAREARQVEAEARIVAAKLRGETPPSLARMMAAIRAEEPERELATARAKDAPVKTAANDAPPAPANDPGSVPSKATKAPIKTAKK